MNNANNKVFDPTKIMREAIDPTKIKCRNDRILVQIKTREEFHGLKMPENSVEGKEYYIVAVGPDVKDLNPGDQVMIDSMEAIGEWAYLPGYSDFMFNGQKHAPLVLVEAKPASTRFVPTTGEQQIKKAENKTEHVYEHIPEGQHFSCDHIIGKVESKQWDPNKVSERHLSMASERQRLRDFLQDFTTPVFNPNDYPGADSLSQSRKQNRVPDWKTAKPAAKSVTENNPRVIVVSDKQFSIGGESFAAPEGNVFDKVNTICSAMWGPGEAISLGNSKWAWELEEK